MEICNRSTAGPYLNLGDADSGYPSGNAKHIHASEPSASLTLRTETQCSGFRTEAQCSEFRTETRCSGFRTEAQCSEFRTETQCSGFRTETQCSGFRCLA
jgi:hypothetical protein